MLLDPRHGFVASLRVVQSDGGMKETGIDARGGFLSGFSAMGQGMATFLFPDRGQPWMAGHKVMWPAMAGHKVMWLAMVGHKVMFMWLAMACHRCYNNNNSRLAQQINNVKDFSEH